MEHFKYQYRVVKTNKKAMTYHFDTLDQLGQYGKKNRYGQGYARLYQINPVTHTETLIESVTDLYNLSDYCTKAILKERENKRNKMDNLLIES